MRGRSPDDALNVSIVGGLGNQLFGCALGLELSRRNDCRLNLLIGDLGGRELGLSGLALPSHVELSPGPSGRREQIMRLLGRMPGPQRIVAERGFAFDPAILDVQPPATMFGYFQSWRYFPTVAEEVRTLVLEGSPYSAEFLRLERDLDALGPFLAVQIRRGDYLTLAAYHGVAGDAYVERALRLMSDDALPVVVFTDDDTGWRPVWADRRKAWMITPGTLPDPRENLVLMSRARDFIISNSSFGWWGAWLAGEGARRVVAPRPWFAHDGHDTRDLLPPGWATVDLRDLPDCRGAA